MSELQQIGQCMAAVVTLSAHSQQLEQRVMALQRQVDALQLLAVRLDRVEAAQQQQRAIALRRALRRRPTWRLPRPRWPWSRAMLTDQVGTVVALLLWVVTAAVLLPLAVAP